MAESGFDFQKLIEDSKSTLINPKGYFASMAKEGGFVEPIIKALVYGIVAGIINLIWSLLHLSGAQWGMFGTGPIAILISSIIAAVIGLFIGGIIMLIISAICGGSTNYEANVRVTAALMVLSPVSALLGFFTGISLTLGTLVSFIVALYGLFMMYNALVKSLAAKEGTAKIVSIVLAVILIIFLISALTCGSKASKYMDTKELQEKVNELKEMKEKNQ